MRFQIEYVVYIYIGVCIAMMLFNVFLLLFRYLQERYMERVGAAMERRIGGRIEGWESGLTKADGLTRADVAYYRRRLKSSLQLICFFSAASRIREREPEKAGAFLKAMQPVFFSLVVSYEKKKDMEQAYFAFVCSQLGEGIYDENNLLAGYMLRLVLSDSAYCRENALKALYRFGNLKNVCRAFIRMNENGIFHHEKLLTDGLLSFQGNREELAERLWEQFPRFREEIQVAVLQFIRAVSGKYAEIFLNCLRGEQGMGRESKIAMLRYFTRYVYEPARAYLYDLLENGEWEFAMTAAVALRLYPCRETIERLKRSLLHSNWYVRYNAAESLEGFHLDYETLSSVYGGKNRFAREMLLYQKQRSRVHEKSEGEG